MARGSLSRESRRVEDLLDVSRVTQGGVELQRPPIELGSARIEVARRLRERPEMAGVRIVALACHGQSDDVRRAIEAGFDGRPVTSRSTSSSLLARSESLAVMAGGKRLLPL